MPRVHNLDETGAGVERVDEQEPQRAVEVLSQVECRRLLATAVLGRVGFTEDALPTIQPVHFVVHRDDVIIPTRVGSKMAAASREAVVAFEVDEFDPGTRTGWNVTVIGPSRVVQDADELRDLEALGAQAWAPPDTPCYIALRISIVRGRRLHATAQTVVSARPQASPHSARP